jgi:hypothetical protein
METTCTSLLVFAEHAPVKSESEEVVKKPCTRKAKTLRELRRQLRQEVKSKMKAKAAEAKQASMSEGRHTAKPLCMVPMILIPHLLCAWAFPISSRLVQTGFSELYGTQWIWQIAFMWFGKSWTKMLSMS